MMEPKNMNVTEKNCNSCKKPINTKESYLKLPDKNDPFRMTFIYKHMRCNLELSIGKHGRHTGNKKHKPKSR